MTILTDIKRVREELDQLVASRKGGLSFEELRAYEDEPARFFEEVLGVDYLWHKQADLLNTIRDQGRVAVVSANGVGKTWALARAALWFLYCPGAVSRPHIGSR